MSASPALIIAFLSAGLCCGVGWAGQPQAMPEVLIPIRMPGDPAISLPDQAVPSGLPLTWEVATGPAAISGNVVTLTGGLGPVTLKASQSGNETWNPLVEQVCFSVTEEGGYAQVSLPGHRDRSIFGISRSGRITAWESKNNGRPVTTRADTRWRCFNLGGGEVAFAVSENGELWAWRESFASKLSTLTGLAEEPVRIGQDSDWREVAAGYRLRTGIKTDGSLWIWEDDPLRINRLPALNDSRTDWAEAVLSSQDYFIARRADGKCYFQNYPNSPYLVPGDLVGPWTACSISQGGLMRVKTDGTLWFTYGKHQQISPATDWMAVAALRVSFVALNAGGNLWEGNLTVRNPMPPPLPMPTKTKWAKISPGYQNFGVIARDGSIWAKFGTSRVAPGNVDGGLTRIAPDFFLQTLDFMAAREQPFPVVNGSTLEVPETALNSRLPLELTVVSGPAVIAGQGISFTGPGLVEVNFKQGGNGTWSYFEERRTFLSGAPGPEIAVHDGTLASSPARKDAGAVVALGTKTRAELGDGVRRAFVIENTGTAPLHLSAISLETPGPLTFTTPFSPTTVAPGDSVLLELTLSAFEYGEHPATILIHSDDADEGAYRIPFWLTLENTPPDANTGPDRQIPAGRSVRVDAAFFTTDQEQAAVTLTYEWDWDGLGYHTPGAVQEITLAQPGQQLTGKLRVTDGDGAVTFSSCTFTAVAEGMTIPTAIRARADGFYDLVFHGIPGKKYRVYISNGLEYWERIESSSYPEVPPIECGPDGFFAVHANRRYGEKSFYRSRQEPD